MSKPIMSKPLGARVLLRVEKSSDHTPGGVILPEDARESANKGTVLAVGAGEPTPGGGWQDVPLLVGDSVLFAPMSGVDMMIEGQQVRLVSFHDIVVNLYTAPDELTDAQRAQLEHSHATEPISESIAASRS